MPTKVESKTIWLYTKQPDTHGWRLAVSTPFTDEASAIAVARILKSQFTFERQFSIREDGKKSFKHVAQ